MVATSSDTGLSPTTSSSRATRSTQAAWLSQSVCTATQGAPRFTATPTHSASSSTNRWSVKSPTVSTQGSDSPRLVSSRRVAAASSGLVGLALPANIGPFTSYSSTPASFASIAARTASGQERFFQYCTEKESFIY